METITVEVADRVAWVTLNRPDVLNAFDRRMQAELRRTWRDLRADAEVRAVVLTGAGDRAFCTGIDRAEALGEGPPADDDGLDVHLGAHDTPFHFDDPGAWLGPKTNQLWKPVVCAVNGMACGGAFYMLGEADVIIAADEATFFDPHTTYGMAAVFESIHMAQRMPFGEVLRMQLMGAHERLSAATALRIGLVSEVVPRSELADAAGAVATAIAAQPARAVQATLRSIWTAKELSRSQALDAAVELVHAGTDPEALAEGQRTFASGQRLQWRLR